MLASYLRTATRPTRYAGLPPDEDPIRNYIRLMLHSQGTSRMGQRAEPHLQQALGPLFEHHQKAFEGARDHGDPFGLVAALDTHEDALGDREPTDMHHAAYLDQLQELHRIITSNTQQGTLRGAYGTPRVHSPEALENLQLGIRTPRLNRPPLNRSLNHMLALRGAAPQSEVDLVPPAGINLLHLAHANTGVTPNHLMGLHRHLLPLALHAPRRGTVPSGFGGNAYDAVQGIEHVLNLLHHHLEGDE